MVQMTLLDFFPELESLITMSNNLNRYLRKHKEFRTVSLSMPSALVKITDYGI